MTFDELKDKALSLPYAPGVYIMRDQTDQVIYVGKAKKLKNRVSQYFQDTASHTPKTRTMVSKIHHFDVIVAASEFEALVLEKRNALRTGGNSYDTEASELPQAVPTGYWKRPSLPELPHESVCRLVSAIQNLLRVQGNHASGQAAAPGKL